MPADDLPISEYAFPGPLRDRLLAAIRSGAKTTTTFLLRELDVDGEPLPDVGSRASVVDSSGASIGIETIEQVRVVRLADVDEEHARNEGEGHATVAEWRDAHERYWHGTDYRTWLGDPTFRVDDDTLAVLVRFRFEATAHPA